MSNMGDCKSTELICRQRADADIQNRHKWLAQAERWRELAGAENSWRLQKTTQQVMHAGQWQHSRMRRRVRQDSEAEAVAAL